MSYPDDIEPYTGDTVFRRDAGSLLYKLEKKLDNRTRTTSNLAVKLVETNEKVKQKELEILELHKKSKTVNRIVSKKQLKFVKAYILNPNKKIDIYLSCFKATSRASASAGANRILQQPHIKACIDEELLALKTHQLNSEKIDKSFIINELKELAERSKYKDDAKYLIESLDMLCKIGGFYAKENPNNINLLNQGNGTIEISFGDFNPDSVDKNVKSLPTAEQDHEYTNYEDTDVKND